MRPNKSIHFVCRENQWLMAITGHGIENAIKIKREWITKLKQYEWTFNPTTKIVYARPVEHTLTWDEVAFRENLNKEH